MTATAPPTRGTDADLPPATRPWFGGLEAVRFAAAFVVLLHHAGFATGVTYRWGDDGGLVGQLIGRLDVGVTVFFVLSGFVLFRPYVDDQFAGRPPQPTRPFWLRRLVRIYPAYWVALVIQLAVGAVAVTGVVAFVANFFLVQTYSSATHLQGITQAWTLCAELGFYLALPWLASLGRRLSTGRDVARQASRLLLFCLAIMAISVPIRVGAFVVFPRSESTIADLSLLWTTAHLDAFGAGMALAVVSAWAGHQRLVDDTFRAIGRPVWAWWATAVAAFWFVSTQWGLAFGLTASSVEREIVRQTLYVVVAVAVIVPIVAAATPARRGDAATPDDRSRALRLIERPTAVWLGSLTYGIYLWHQAVISWCFDLFGWDMVFEGNYLVVVVFATVGSIVIAALSRRFVEDPVQRIAKDRIGGPRMPSTSAGAAS